MCGIVGAIAFNEFKITEPYIAKMRDTMTHRGPDGYGVWLAEEGNIGLGHRRLSIIDLTDNAAQPMRTADGRYTLTYNGEIYNHREIRQELIALGVSDWRSDHSDTEALLKAFQHWGIQCLHKFRGMFAFAIWDAKLKELWLVRDRVGIKPLYYSQHHNRLVFASEIKALLADPQQQRAVDTQAFYHYLSFLTTPSPMTLFEGINKLEAGCYLKISVSGKIEKQRYWDVWDHTQPLIHESEEEIAARILSELKTAVKLRKVSDVPMGVFLSGGIDSSTNAALFSENGRDVVNTFSIGYQGEYDSYKNELHYAKQMAEHINANYYEKLLSIDDLLSFLPTMISLQDEPIADPVCVPVYYVSKLAKENGVTVCQVGEGADELFWGYPTWKIKLNLQRLGHIPYLTPFKKMGLNALKWMGKDQSVQYEMLRRNVAGLPVFWGGAESFTEAEKARLLHPHLKNELNGMTSWDAIAPIWQRYQAKAWDKDSMLNWMSYVDLNFRLPELLLMRVDKMSMGVSLEGRVPFLDHKFIELAMSIPASIKTKNGTLKHILKKSVTGVIPHELIHRKKQGFGVPVYEWLFDKLGDFTRKELTEFSKRTEFFNSQEIKNMLSQKMGANVWYLLNFALWWKHYIAEESIGI